MEKKRIVCFFRNSKKLNVYRDATLNTLELDGIDVVKETRNSIETHTTRYDLVIVLGEGGDNETIFKGRTADEVKIDKSLPIYTIDRALPIVKGDSSKIVFVDIGEVY